MRFSIRVILSNRHHLYQEEIKKMKNLFVNSNSGTLRSGWRVLVFIVILIAITPPVMIGTRAILGSLKGGSPLQISLLAVTATISVVIARKYIDKKTIKSLGLNWDRYAFLDVISGILNSALVMAGIFFLLLGLGLIEFQGFSFWQNPNLDVQTSTWSAVISVFMTLTVVAWWEELVFRGYIFRNLVDGTNLIWATVISSLVFGLIHYTNPDATLLSTFMITLIAPQLIYAYLKTGQLWLPMGLHLGWNFFQASIFGFAASGNESLSLITQSPIGPDWLSGGAFGAEGSILILPFVLLSFFAIHYWVKKSRYPEQKLLEIAVETM